MYSAALRPACPLRASNVFASSRVMIVDIAEWYSRHRLSVGVPPSVELCAAPRM